MADAWDEGNAYERFMGRWSGPVADAFLAWLRPEPEKEWLDVGCGTGALSGRCAALGLASQVEGIDFSPGFIARARKNLSGPLFKFQVGSALQLPVETGGFDYVVSGLALNFFPDQQQALGEMMRALRSPGVLAVYVWDYAGRMEMLRRFWDAAVALHPHAAEQDEGVRFPVCRPEPLRALFEATGLKQVTVTPIDTIARYENFDDFWEPFLLKNGPAPSYLAGLSSADQQTLAENLRQSLPAAADGSITLTLRAWGVKGEKTLGSP